MANEDFPASGSAVGPCYWTVLSARVTGQCYRPVLLGSAAGPLTLWGKRTPTRFWGRKHWAGFFNRLSLYHRRVVDVF